MVSGIGSASSQAKMSGLVSGLDTEELVKNMTLGIRTKINRQLQTKQTMQWKMDAYRSVSNKMINFQNKFLSYTSASSLLAQSFYNSSTVKAKGDNAGAVTVSGTSSSSKSLSIQNIVSYATNAAMRSTDPVASAKITTGTIDFSANGKTINNLAGESLNVSYGGETFTIQFDSDFTGTTNADVAAAFNTAIEGRLLSNGETLSSVLSMTDTGSGLALGATSSTDGNEIKLVGGSTKALQSTGLTVGSTTTGTSEPITGNVDPSKIESQVAVDGLKGKQITFNLNGTNKTITIGDVTDRESLVASVQSELNKAFGDNRVKVELNAQDQLSFETVRKENGNVVTDGTALLSITSADTGVLGTNGILNTSGVLSNRLSLASAVTDNNFNVKPVADSNNEFKVNINGTEFTLKADESVNTFIDRVNTSDAGVKIEYLSTTNQFSVTATNNGAGGKIEISDVSGNLASALFGDNAVVTEGKDAAIEISYDGGLTKTTVTRSTNAFDIDGLNIKLNEGTQFTAGKPITFETTSNSDDLVKKIKEMINDYNDIVKLVNSEVSTKPNSKYAPLTDDQKTDMSESEIELWEKSAKTGLLFADPTLRSLATDLRFVFSFSVPGQGQISDLGITSATAYKDNGQIVLDEAKLKKAIEEDPDRVMKMFLTPKSTEAGATNNDAGIVDRMKAVMDKYVATIGENKGTFIKMVGVENSYLETQSSYYTKMKEIDIAVTNLKRTQVLEETRYYNQFTALEKYISQMNSQSSWLSSFGG